MPLSEDLQVFVFTIEQPLRSCKVDYSIIDIPRLAIRDSEDHNTIYGFENYCIPHTGNNYLAELRNLENEIIFSESIQIHSVRINRKSYFQSSYEIITKLSEEFLFYAKHNKYLSFR